MRIVASVVLLSFASALAFAQGPKPCEVLKAEIAKKLDGRSQDVRDAIRIARLAPHVGVEKAIKLLLGGE